jgi:hypothetical protein
MDKPTKTVLIVIGSILVLWAVAAAGKVATGLWAFSRFDSFPIRGICESPQVAVRLGPEIADFEVPVGFGSPYSIHFGNMTLIGYTSIGEESQFLLAQFPQGTRINLDEMLRIIRGEACRFHISDGVSSGGIEFHLATTKGDGRGGPALVIVAGSIDERNEEMVETFVESIQRPIEDLLVIARRH